MVLALALAVGLTGCGAPPESPELTRKPHLTGAHLFIHRPFRTIPEPEPFVVGAMVAIKEELTRSGYDVMGETLDPESDEEVAEILADLQERRPGTAGIELVFVEAPTLIGFGTAYASIECTVYDPRARVLLRSDLEAPEQRPIRDAFVPRAQPDADGRHWGARVWRDKISHLFPPRGQPRGK